MIALDGKSQRISLIDILVVLVMAGLLYLWGILANI